MRHETALSDIPESAAESPAELRAQLDQALSRLPARERMAALLCFAEGYSHGEAALVMDVPLGTLKSVLARARIQLVQCLETDQ